MANTWDKDKIKAFFSTIGDIVAMIFSLLVVFKGGDNKNETEKKL